MAGARLTISSRNYSSWSLRAWLFCQLAELDVQVASVPVDDPNNRAELLLLSPTVLTPRLDHNGASIWDTIAIAEYLEEEFPNKGLLPLDKKPRSPRALDHRRNARRLLQHALGAADEPALALSRLPRLHRRTRRHPPCADDLERVLRDV